MLHCQCQVINKNSIFQLVQSDGHVCKSCVVKVSYAQKNKNKTHTLSLVSFTTHVIKKEKEKQMQKKNLGRNKLRSNLRFYFRCHNVGLKKIKSRKFVDKKKQTNSTMRQ